MKKSIDKFYIATENSLANDNIKHFISLGVKPQTAIDLGCGAGRDSIFLIKNGWTVISIDNENVEHFIAPKLLEQEKLKFKFIQARFEEIEIEKNNLIVANNSLPFCPKLKFNELWTKIVDSIKDERILCWNFLWRKRFLGKNKKKYDIFKQNKHTTIT